MLYCLDTSALIESWWNLYPRDIFPSFWRKLEEAIIAQHLIAPEIVLAEIERQDDDIHKWAKQHLSLFVPLDIDIQLAQIDIVNKFPRLTMPMKNRSLADPWVIALAQIKQCPVVSMEKPGSARKPRIPDVCQYLGIEHFEVVDLIRAMGWRF